jgi:DedD protein
VNEHVRNRVVGLVILVSLAAIFLPMLFDGAGIERRRVPEMPVTDIAPADEPPGELDTTAGEWAFVEEVQRVREAPPAAQVDAQPRHAPVESDAPDGPALDGEGAPFAWSVQLASFESRENAEALRDRLLGDGYAAYRIESHEGGRTLHRVAVGPELDRGDTEALREALARRYDLDGLVVRFVLGPGEVAAAGAAQDRER